MKFQTDFSRVEGLGASKEGPHHWWLQRLSAVALVPLTLLFLFPFMRALEASHSAFVETYSHFGNALVAVLFFFVSFTHLRLGLQVVIEDYVHARGAKTILLVANTLLCWGFMIVGIFAVARIAFGSFG